MIFNVFLDFTIGFLDFKIGLLGFSGLLGFQTSRLQDLDFKTWTSRLDFKTGLQDWTSRLDFEIELQDWTLRRDIDI